MATRLSPYMHLSLWMEFIIKYGEDGRINNLTDYVVVFYFGMRDFDLPEIKLMIDVLLFPPRSSTM